MSREDPQMKIRLPVDLKEQVELAAAEAGRSLNAEIVERLRRTFARSIVPEQERAELVALIEEALRLREQQRAGMAAKPAKKR